jgi:hypothetical protein
MQKHRTCTHFEDVTLSLQWSEQEATTGSETFNFLRTTMRGCKLVYFKHDGKGYIEYIATNKYTEEWKNPYKSGLIGLTASSLHSNGQENSTYGRIFHILELHSTQACFFVDVSNIFSTILKVRFGKISQITQKRLHGWLFH